MAAAAALRVMCAPPLELFCQQMRKMGSDPYFGGLHRLGADLFRQLGLVARELRRGLHRVVARARQLDPHLALDPSRTRRNHGPPVAQDARPANAGGTEEPALAPGPPRAHA